MWGWRPAFAKAMAGKFSVVFFVGVAQSLSLGGGWCERSLRGYVL
jgi:hypothetical protein